MAKRATATAAPAKKPSRPRTGEDHAKAVRGLVRDFRKNLPPGSEEGLYGPTQHDRWHKRKVPVPDGSYKVGDWFVTIAGERFTGAVRSDRKKFAPKHFTELDPV